MSTHGLLWRKRSDGHWAGSPPGCWAWAEVIRQSVIVPDPDHVVYGGRKIGDEWLVRLVAGRRTVGRWPDADTAMRYADSLWDQHPAQTRF